MNPIYKDFLDVMCGASSYSYVDDELYALSEVIQWIFRSAIRENKEIYAFIPSYRMRETILQNHEELFRRGYTNYITYTIDTTKFLKRMKDELDIRKKQ